jgi:hypothetical protein
MISVTIADTELEAAVEAYREFHGVDPERILPLGEGRKVLLMLGLLREIVYKPTRGERRGPAFIHHVGPSVALAATADGEVVLVPLPGSRFRFDPEYGLMD